jgi:hypothetical protein
MHTCVCVYLYICYFFVCLSEYTLQLVAYFSVSPRCRSLYLNNNQLSALPSDIFAGLSSLQWVCVFLVAEDWDTFAWVQVLIYYLTYICLCFSCCLCVCVLLCHGVHRQTNRHSWEISEIVPAHRRARTHAEITRTPLSCGGDECDADSLSLLRHIYIHRHTSMHVCLFAFLGIRDSWLPNSDSLSLLIQSYIPTCILLYVCMYICSLFFLFCLFVWVYLPPGCLTLCFSSSKLAFCVQRAAAVRSDQCPAAEHNVRLRRTCDVYVDTVDSGLWRLHL